MGRRGRNGPGDDRFPVEESTYMKPSAIRYTQDSIKYEFIDGTLLTDTLRDLLYGGVTPEDIDSIGVIWHDNNYYAVCGNRRLYLYKQMQNRSLLTTIPVDIVSCSQHVFDQYYTTNNYGKSIRVRGGTGCHEEVQNMITKFITDRRRDRGKERRNQRQIQQLAWGHDEENQQHNVRPNTNYTPLNQDVVNRNNLYTPSSTGFASNVDNNRLNNKVAYPIQVMKHEDIRTDTKPRPMVIPPTAGYKSTTGFSGSSRVTVNNNTRYDNITSAGTSRSEPTIPAEITRHSEQNRPASSRSSSNYSHRYETRTQKSDVDYKGNTSSGGLLSRIARLFTCCCRPSKSD